jgi:hypothetical protein
MSIANNFLGAGYVSLTTGRKQKESHYFSHFSCKEPAFIGFASSLNKKVVYLSAFKQSKILSKGIKLIAFVET